MMNVVGIPAATTLSEASMVASGTVLPETDRDSHSRYYNVEGTDVAIRLTHLYWRSDYEGGWSELAEFDVSDYSTIELRLDSWYP